MILYEASLQYKTIETPATPSTCTSGPQAAANALTDAFAQNPYQETVWILLLNRQQKLMARCKIFTGSQTQCLLNPAEIFHILILGRATSFILAHNHPSGDPTPSPEDIIATHKISKLAKIMGIPLNDHIIIGNPEEDPNKLGYFSFQEQGNLPKPHPKIPSTRRGIKKT
jgi:DNA repair protein RadC